MNETRRQKRVASLIQEELSSIFIRDIQNSKTNLITVTRVEMNPDLKEARVYISILDSRERKNVLDILEEKKGYLRKTIASKIKLKYNPLLIFSIDPVPDYETRINRLINKIHKNEKKTD